MGKKFIEKHSLAVEGMLDIKEMTLDIEEVGTKSLEEILAKFDGDVIKISVNKSNEVE